MEKLTRIEQIEIHRRGTVQVKMRKILIDDDGVEHDLGVHRTSIEPGADPDALFAEVNAHLGRMKMAPVSLEEISGLCSHVALAHTPEKVAEFRARKEAAEREVRAARRDEAK